MWSSIDYLKQCNVFQTSTFQVAYISAGDSAFAFYSYEKDGMLLEIASQVPFIGHMYGGEIYGKFNSVDGTRLYRPDQYFDIDSTCLRLKSCILLFAFVS